MKILPVILFSNMVSVHKSSNTVSRNHLTDIKEVKFQVFAENMRERRGMGTK